MLIQLKFIFLNVFLEIISSHDLRNFNELIVIVIALKERFFFKYLNVIQEKITIDANMAPELHMSSE